MDTRQPDSGDRTTFLDPSLTEERFTRMVLQIFRGFPDGLIITGTKQNILYANERAFRLFHVSYDLILQSEFHAWMKSRKPDGNLDNWIQPYYHRDRVKLYEVTSRPIYAKDLGQEGTAYFIHDLTPSHNKSAGYEYLISHDNLTGLLNREGFFMEARKRLDENPFEDYTLVTFNIVNFKSFSNKDGNDILKKFGWLLQNKVRHGDISGRMYADRFISLMQTRNHTPELMQTIRATMYEYGIHTGHKIIYETRSLHVLDHNDAVDKMCEAAFQKELNLKPL